MWADSWAHESSQVELSVYMSRVKPSFFISKASRVRAESVCFSHWAEPSLSRTLIISSPRKNHSRSQFVKKFYQDEQFIIYWPAANSIFRFVHQFVALFFSLLFSNFRIITTDCLSSFFTIIVGCEISKLCPEKGFVPKRILQMV